MSSGMVVSDKILVTEAAMIGGFRVMSYHDKLAAAIQLLRSHMALSGGCDEVEALVSDLIKEFREEA